MKYKCLVLDHDDTVIKSTPSIHYPSFIVAQKEMRPNMKPYTLDEFITFCFDPGFHNLRDSILKFTPSEVKRQQEIWKDYTNRVIPEFYEGISEIILSFKKAGGHICVVSHSEESIILRDYKDQLGIEPSFIFGWGEDEKKMKPSPYPLEKIMKELDLTNSDLLVVDDLKPGLDMAKCCNVDFACAGWSHNIPSIQTYMTANSDYYFTKVSELKNLVSVPNL